MSKTYFIPKGAGLLTQQLQGWQAAALIESAARMPAIETCDAVPHNQVVLMDGCRVAGRIVNVGVKEDDPNGK